MKKQDLEKRCEHAKEVKIAGVIFYECLEDAYCLYKVTTFSEKRYCASKSREDWK